MKVMAMVVVSTTALSTTTTVPRCLNPKKPTKPKAASELSQCLEVPSLHPESPQQMP